MICKK